MNASTAAKKILVVEDEADIAELIEFNLRRNGGFDVEVVSNGEQAIQTLLRQGSLYSMVLLDIMLPGKDGISVLKAMRSEQNLQKIPVVMLTAKTEEADIVIGLELGADDYIPKPFSPRELLARVRSVLRRSSDNSSQHLEGRNSQSQVVRLGPLSIDQDRHQISVDGVNKAFTLAEFRLLALMASKPGRVFTRDQLLEKVSGGDTYVIDRNIDVHVRAIRKKLENHADLIETVRGIGYKCREFEPSQI
jgi:two-component system alkaline phosphatase synthesis response regulator PhoP